MSGRLGVNGDVQARIQRRLRSYTPTLTAATTNPTLTTQEGKFVVSDGICLGWARIVLSAAGSGVYTVGLPVAAAGATTERNCGMVVFRSSTVRSTGRVRPDGTMDGFGGDIGTAQLTAAANPLELTITWNYEVA